MSAKRAIGATTDFEDALNVVNELARAKAEIDIASWHDLAIAGITSEILIGVRKYLDDSTIACTEWPMPSEISEKVFQDAARQALA
jgi:hypothetical protein